MKDRRKKITMESLVDHFENRLKPDLARQVQERLASDPEAQSTLNWLRRLTPSLSAAVSTHELNPSASAIEAVHQMYRDRQSHARPVSLATLVARLVFDSRRSVAPSGARGDLHANCLAVYSTDDHDVDIWQERLADGTWYLIGQVLPKNGGDAVLPRYGALSRSDDVTLLTETGDGEFFIPSAPQGRYDLCLELEDRRIVLGDVAVGASVV
jgi:hypothetical protein